MANLYRVGEFVSNVKHEVKRFIGITMLAVSLTLLAACGASTETNTVTDGSMVQVSGSVSPEQATASAVEDQPGFTEVQVLDVYKNNQDGSCATNLSASFLREGKKLFPLDCNATLQAFYLVKQKGG